MLTSAPKSIRENIARAKGYLRRDEVERALVTMSEALRQLAEIRLARSARAEVEIQIDEFLAALVRHSVLQPLLDPADTGNPRSITLQQGKEAALSTVLEGLAKILQTSAEQAVQQEAESRLARKKQLIGNGLDFLREGQVAKARAFLKRIVEEFGDEDGIRLQMGQIFSAAGLFAEAAAMYEESMALQPREAAAYTGAVAAWMELREYEKAEAVYKTVLRTFGGHASTFGKMAKLYLEWHKKHDAEEAALRALQTDPEQADALEVMAALNKGE